MIDAQTQLYGVIGNPVRHSLSPMIHNGAFRRMGLNAVYLAFEVRDLKGAIDGMRSLGIRGVSVTIPFKMKVIPFLDAIEDGARKIKAVNTLLHEEDRLVGYNTDGCGALEALEEKVDLKGKRVLLLGAGGAARAIGFSLKTRDCELIISNRTMDRAAGLAKELRCAHQPLSSIEDLSADVVINATSVGMHPRDQESPLPQRALKREMTVMDIVYKPLQTKFLREAEEAGCLTINGLEMLSRQGAGQLEIWTGKRPDILEIKNDLRRALQRE